MEVKEKKVVIFGDSILKPIVINESKRFVVSDAVDWKSIENNLGVVIENRSKMGATIRHGMGYLAECLKNDKSFHAAVICYGGNDSDYNWKQVSENGNVKHLPNTSLDEFEVILNNMIDSLVENNIKVILMTLQPISSIMYYNWFMRNGLNKENIMKHLGDIETIARHQELYNNIIIKTAYGRGIDIVDIRREFLDSPVYATMMCEDGIHPNALGEQLIADAFIRKYGKAVRVAG